MRKLAVTAICLLSLNQPPVFAGCRPSAAAGKHKESQHKPVIVAVKLAVPTVYYRYSHYAASYASSNPPVDVMEDDAPLQSRPAATASSIAQSCLACHGPKSPQAGLDLSNLEKLSAGQRLKAIARVASDDPNLRMPPGQPLAPAAMSQLLQQLSRAGEAAP
ncbi:MAG: c-type cytochrome domain-containing protein [Pirellulales bacterium]